MSLIDVYRLSEHFPGATAHLCRRRPETAEEAREQSRGSGSVEDVAPGGAGIKASGIAFYMALVHGDNLLATTPLELSAPTGCTVVWPMLYAVGD